MPLQQPAGSVVQGGQPLGCDPAFRFEPVHQHRGALALGLAGALNCPLLIALHDGVGADGHPLRGVERPVLCLLIGVSVDIGGQQIGGALAPDECRVTGRLLQCRSVLRLLFGRICGNQLRKPLVEVD
ncbi:hypothetical protein [Streptomyces sp. HUAS ZL42]|uniref:hypothetical protein n=1 Tax=Streptomyces sp. HUAS ZL42 TaxID=3231715 RepID=UPI00345ED3C5